MPLNLNNITREQFEISVRSHKLECSNNYYYIQINFFFLSSRHTMEFELLYVAPSERWFSFVFKKSREGRSERFPVSCDDFERCLHFCIPVLEIGLLSKLLMENAVSYKKKSYKGFKSGNFNLEGGEKVR